MSSGGGSSSSGGGGGGNAKGSSTGTGAGVQAIPATSRKMVQSLKEIVNCPEHEIYAMLKECNMDPNDTVHRLLSQDPFHEVKSRREKKKELKEASELRGRAVSNTLNYGSKGTDRHVGRAGSSQFSSSETGILRKPAYKKDNGTVALSSSTNFSGTQGNDINRWPVYHSDSVPAENKTQVTGASDVISSSSQLPSGFQPSSQPNSGIQSAWLGVPGQLSMADIVKMGRPKASSTPTLSTNSSHSAHDSALLITSHQNIKRSLDPASVPLESHHDFDASGEPSKISAPVHGTGIVASQHVSHDEWPLVEQSSASGSTLLEASAVSEVYGDPSISPNLSTDKVTLHLTSLSDEVQGMEDDVPVDNLSTDCIGSASVSGRQIQDDRSGGPSQFDNDSLNNIDSFQPHRHAFKHQEGTGVSSQLSIPNYSVPSVEDASISVSSAAANLKQLSLQEGLGEAPTEDNPAVIIPNHLQVPTADCSHLSFGSFGSGANAAYPMSFGSKSLKSNLEDVSAVENASSIGHSDTRNSKYFADEPLQSNSDGNVAPRSTVGAGSYDSSSSQQEVMKHDAAEATHGHQYSFPTSVTGYTSENSAQLNTGFMYAQTNSQMQNLAPLSSVMQAYTNSLQGNLLASTGQTARESDLPYSPFLATQSMPTKYSNAVSSISGPAISIPETVKPVVFSMPPAPQSLPGNSIATGPALPHLTVHPYSQPTLPLGHFANMIGYPFLPQSYTYMPSAFQQAYGSNNTYHQSPAAVHSAGIKYTLPQYKSSVDLNSLPQSAAVASGHGGFGASANNVPGNFSLNSSSTPVSTTIRYDDAVSSQFKDNNHFVSLHQNENSGVWVHGPGSRTVPTLPASTYYSFQGQNQQHSGLRQVQQPSQHYGAPGYSNFYHSQAGISQEHQQQNPSDGALGGSQGQQTKQSHQIWQHSY